MNHLSDQEILELHDLIDGLVENNLSKEKLVYLENWIAKDPLVRRYYIEFMDMNASLHSYAEELISDETNDSIDEKSTKLISFLNPIMAIAAIIILGLFFFNDINSLFNSPSNDLITDFSVDDSPLEISTSEVIVDTVAVLTKSVGIRWGEATDFKPELGDTLEASTLNLASGLAQVEFLQGATVVLEGPVEFLINNPNEGSLASGKLRAIVPKVATGFTVNLPKGRVIDLGTDFGLHVHAGGSTELFVYQGNVIYEGKADSGEEIIREVTAGESIFVDPYGNPSWVEMPSEPFISAADLAFRSMEESQRRHAAWVDLSNSIAADPSTLLYFTFDNHNTWSRILQNVGLFNSSARNGAIVGCNWSEGRWSGKGALSFNRKNDRVRLELPNNVESATFSAWLKIDSLEQKLLPIFCSDSTSLGSTSWSINQNGQLALSIQTSKGDEIYESAVAFRMDSIGRWNHVVSTYDSKKMMVTHYVNGRPFSREKLTSAVLLNFRKAMLGHSAPLKKSQIGVAFKGSIDEFGIFEVAYNEDQIRNIYEIGRPYELPKVLGSRLP